MGTEKVWAFFALKSVLLTYSHGLHPDAESPKAQNGVGEEFSAHRVSVPESSS